MRHSVFAGRLAKWIALVAAGGLLAGCELFKPAIPEAPVTGGIQLNYSTMDAVLETLAKGVEAKTQGGGQAAYGGAFADSTVDGVPYYATFVPEVKRRYEASGRTAPTWNYRLEYDFFADLAGLRQESYGMLWIHDDTMFNDDRGTETATLYRRYQIIARAPDGSTLGYVALGLADIHLQKTPRGRWAIVRWIDRVDLVTPTFGADPYNLTMSARRLGVR